MSIRTEPRSAPRQRRRIWWLVLASGVLLVAGLIVAWISPLGIYASFDLLPGTGILWTAVFTTVGATIAHNRPSNSIGWLMLVGGVLAACGFLASNLLGVMLDPELIEYLEATQPSSEIEFSLVPLPAILVRMFALITWGGVECVAFLVILLFPDGKPPSPRWRVAGWLIVGYLVIFGLAALIGTVLAGIGLTGTELVDVVGAVGFFYGPLMVPLVLVAFVLRYRRSSSIRRQQLKWLLYAVSLFVAFTLVNLIPAVDLPGLVGGLGLTLGLVLIPVAIAMAILRHGVYDIDLVINRTVVYGVVMVLLGLVYVAGVVGIPRLLDLGGQNDLAVAASTLLVVGVFNPLRRRVQRFVDRRFYRARYDARRTVESFATRLQDTSDPEQIEEELTEVVSRTVQPALVGVWVKDESEPGQAT